MLALRDQAVIMTAGMSAAAFILVEAPSLRMVAVIVIAGLIALMIAWYLEAKVK